MRPGIGERYRHASAAVSAKGLVVEYIDLAQLRRLGFRFTVHVAAFALLRVRFGLACVRHLGAHTG